MDIANIPPESFKPVVCPGCGCPIFSMKIVMQYYKGMLTPTPVLKEVPMRLCDNCGLPFDKANITTVNSTADVRIKSQGVPALNITPP